ncbi:L-histidine N(alpha)-methyltransferase [Tellurirhabdus rosea]|uniref:L-histidine N(alpha)-methyltransferase n=1 Tax=Tellurirhabdus rosea TaxID=2674997 RepID=UPI00224FAE46|nr:L-histidine N(alpha)-methyltransferase [Tellurirhabdus rosea]
MMNNEQLVGNEVAEAVREGLSQSPRRLPSWLLYDTEGSRLFAQIMHLPEYYLTRSEFEIFAQYKEDFARLFSPGGEPFELIELGPGDGLKTKVLLRHFVEQNLPFSYIPVDISEDALNQLAAALQLQWPGLDVRPQHDDYFRALALLSEEYTRKVVLFLGSNIGNYAWDEIHEFYHQLSRRLRPGDLVVTGFDLQKHPAVIQAAYTDSAGLTRAFNLNLLRRLNRELDATFDLSAWDHYETYNPETGEARSYLVSQKAQTVRFGALDWEVTFPYADLIHTEISRKFRAEEINRLAAQTGFAVKEWKTDCKGYFADVVFERLHTE